MPNRRHEFYANIILSIHIAWTIFLLAGIIGMFFYTPYAAVQIAVMSFTLLIPIPFGNTCPLTLLEEKLRRKIDPRYTNEGSYIATYLNKIFHTDIPTRRVNETLAGLYILAFALAISIVILRGYGFFGG